MKDTPSLDAWLVTRIQLSMNEFKFKWKADIETQKPYYENQSVVENVFAKLQHN